MSSTKIMAILNLTPDSFSDGIPNATSSDFLHKAKTLIEDGADILDIGGESTRPDSAPVSVQIEIERVLGFLDLFRKDFPSFPVSLDTKKYNVALSAMPYGIQYLNDVSFLGDVRLAQLAKHSGCFYILMHTRGNHADMQKNTVYSQGLFATLKAEILEKLAVLQDMNFPQDQLILDPGFGFAKTPEQCVELMNDLSFWRQFSLPLLIGVSRKRFLQKYCGDVPAPERDQASADCAVLAQKNGFTFFRVHNVKMTKNLLTEAHKTG